LSLLLAVLFSTNVIAQCDSSPPECTWEGEAPVVQLVPIPFAGECEFQVLYENGIFENGDCECCTGEWYINGSLVSDEPCELGHTGHFEPGEDIHVEVIIEGTPFEYEFTIPQDYGAPCTPPEVSTSTSCMDNEDESFYINVAISEGSSQTYSISNSYDNSTYSAMTGTTTMIGPFPNSTAVTVTVQGLNGCIVTRSGISRNCEQLDFCWGYSADCIVDQQPHSYTRSCDYDFYLQTDLPYTAVNWIVPVSTSGVVTTQVFEGPTFQTSSYYHIDWSDLGDIQSYGPILPEICVELTLSDQSTIVDCTPCFAFAFHDPDDEDFLQKLSDDLGVSIKLSPSVSASGNTISAVVGEGVFDSFAGTALIIDQYGNVIKRQHLRGTTFNIQTSGLRTGVYNVVVKDKSNQLTLSSRLLLTDR